MTLISEYKDVPADAARSTRITLETGEMVRTNRQIKLVEILEGWTTAGSMARWQEHRFGISFEFDGAMHGKQFITHMAARHAFDHATGNEI
jgi:hypothetical protein